MEWKHSVCKGGWVGGGWVGGSWCGTLRVFYQAAGAGGEVTWWHLSGGKNLISPPGSHIFTLAHTHFYTDSHTFLHGHTALPHKLLHQTLQNRPILEAWEGDFDLDYTAQMHYKVIFDSISNSCNVWYFKICWLSLLICSKVWWSIRPFAFSERHVWEVL